MLVYSPTLVICVFLKAIVQWLWKCPKARIRRHNVSMLTGLLSSPNHWSAIYLSVVQKAGSVLTIVVLKRLTIWYSSHSNTFFAQPTTQTGSAHTVANLATGWTNISIYNNSTSTTLVNMVIILTTSTSNHNHLLNKNSLRTLFLLIFICSH